MPSLVTTKFRHHNADQFFEAFSEASPSYIYMFIGRVRSWSNDFDPPTPVDAVANTEFEHWNDMIAAKRTNSTDVTYAVVRTNWVTGTVYAEYSDKAALADTNYFVLTDAYNVYKCLYNNKGAASSVKPTGTTTSKFSTSDDYIWKFMYTIDAADALKWVTESYIPVTTLTSDDGSTQWDVQQAAANGAVDVIDVVNTGAWAGGAANYNTGTLAAVANTSQMTLAAGAGANNGIYTGSTIYITSGTGIGQQSVITDYNGTSKVVQLTTAFATAPTTASKYSVAPTVTITGDGHTGRFLATAIATMNTTTNLIQTVVPTFVGNNYSQATVSFAANGFSGATATTYIAPPGGHGADPVQELGGYNVMLNTKFDKTESGVFTTGNDFRKVGVLRDPLLPTGAAATNTAYDQSTTLNITGISGSYNVDEIVTGGTSAKTGRVIDANTSQIRVTSTSGTFTETETLTGAGSGATATLASIRPVALRKYSGDVIYVEQRSPISRAADQIEDVKLIIKF